MVDLSRLLGLIFQYHISTDNYIDIIFTNEFSLWNILKLNDLNSVRRVGDNRIGFIKMVNTFFNKTEER